MQFCVESFLEAIVKPMGKFIEADLPTLMHTRPAYARVCVEIDLYKKRETQIWIGETMEKGFWQEIEYEKAPSYCMECSLQGHEKYQCTRLKGFVDTRNADNINEKGNMKILNIKKAEKVQQYHNNRKFQKKWMPKYNKVGKGNEQKGMTVEIEAITETDSYGKSLQKNHKGKETIIDKTPEIRKESCSLIQEMMPLDVILNKKRSSEEQGTENELVSIVDTQLNLDGVLHNETDRSKDENNLISFVDSQTELTVDSVLHNMVDGSKGDYAELKLVSIVDTHVNLDGVLHNETDRSKGGSDLISIVDNQAELIVDSVLRNVVDRRKEGYAEITLVSIVDTQTNLECVLHSEAGRSKEESDLIFTVNTHAGLVVVSVLRNDEERSKGDYTGENLIIHKKGLSERKTSCFSDKEVFQIVKSGCRLNGDKEKSDQVSLQNSFSKLMDTILIDSCVEEDYHSEKEDVKCLSDNGNSKKRKKKKKNRKYEIYKPAGMVTRKGKKNLLNG